jgi:hypothetical protein
MLSDMESGSASFFPPPNWPMPTGWLPPASWAPDLTWTPAPTGWVFYRTPAGTPAAPPPGCWTPTQPNPSLPNQPVTPVTPQPAPTPQPNPTYLATQAAPQMAAQAPTAPPGFPNTSGTPSYPPAPAPAKRSKTSLIIGLSAGALVLLIIAGIVAFILLRNPYGPRLSESQFDSLITNFTLNGESQSFASSSTKTSATNCSEFKNFADAHLQEMRTSTGGLLDTITVERIDTVDNARTWLGLVDQCLVSGSTSTTKTSTQQMDKDGESWLEVNSSVYSVSMEFNYWRYGNVLVIFFDDISDSTRAELRKQVQVAASR